MYLLNWKTEFLRILLLLAGAGVIGVFAGLGLWPALFAALGYALWILFQVARLNSWLLARDGSPPPEAAGLWGQVLDILYHNQRGEQEAKRRLQAMIDHMRESLSSLSDAVVMLDSDGSIEWSNPAAADFLGLQQPDDNGRLLLYLLRSPEFVRYFEREEYGQPLETVSPVDSAIRLSISITFFGKRNRLLFARDVTRTHRLEQMRRDFVANISHDLRTPLTVVSGYLETLDEHGGNDPLWTRAIQQMQEQTRLMQALVQDLMTLSRLESLPVSTELQDLRLRSMMDMLRDEILVAASGNREVSVECDETLLLKGNELELRSAFSNLAMNAARYTGPGDRIMLRWRRNKQHACFEVEDTGPGIEAEHIPRLTERFYRVDPSRSRNTGGTGLGLAIVKHVLIRHQAKLRIRSTPGKGSCFTCLFPLQHTAGNSGMNSGPVKAGGASD